MNKQISPDLSLLKMLILFLGTGVSLAVLFMIYQAFVIGTDIRSFAKMIGSRKYMYQKRCNIYIDPPVECDDGFKCEYNKDVLEELNKPNSDKPRYSKGYPSRYVAWGKCMPVDPVPTKPQVLPKISPVTTKAVPSPSRVCDLTRNPPVSCSPGYYCMLSEICLNAADCAGNEKGICVKNELRAPGPPTTDSGCWEKIVDSTKIMICNQ